MNANHKCPKCGAPLTGDALDGLCAACVVQVMRDVPTMVSRIEQPGDKIGHYQLLHKIGGHRWTAGVDDKR
ncbi:MAG: hypothetical protein KJ072_26740, partial [Verrucomicrobia bacterium]|nr:hypothetical protein [Verrucomicrobiota bacterium]